MGRGEVFCPSSVACPLPLPHLLRPLPAQEALCGPLTEYSIAHYPRLVKGFREKKLMKFYTSICIKIRQDYCITQMRRVCWSSSANAPLKFYPFLGIKNRVLRAGFSNQNLLTPCPCENSTASRPPRGITIRLASSRRTLLTGTDRNQQPPHKLAQSLKELSQVQCLLCQPPIFFSCSWTFSINC